MAAVDVVSWENDWPSALESWCSVSLMELQAAANALRAQGDSKSRPLFVRTTPAQYFEKDSYRPGSSHDEWASLAHSRFGYSEAEQ